jgi:nucleotide-binding universal stress UspA family protein/GNAT superfamily N-acetyltransferase
VTRDDMATEGEEVRLQGGERVLIRQVRPGDKPLLVGGFERLSAESRYRRFLAHMSELSDEELAYLTEVDHSSHEALGALEPESGEGLGIARYIRSEEDPERAEVAVAVVDDWQNRGLGRALLERLSDRAREEGISRFSAVVQADNQRALALLEQLGRSERSSGEGEVELDIALPSEGGLGSELATALRAAAASIFAFPALGERISARARALYEGRTTPQPAPPSRAPVVVGTDGSAAATGAVRAAAELARVLDAPLHLVTAFRTLSWRRLTLEPGAEAQPLDWTGRGEADARAVLERATEAVGESVEPRQHAVRGDPSEVLLDVARDLEAQLLVVGDSGASGLARFPLGTVPHRVSHHAPCNVLIVRTGR